MSPIFCVDILSRKAMFYMKRVYPEDAKEKFDMRILSYCIMPNHWHLALYPKKDGDLSKWMSWITNTHTRRWHVIKETIEQGHLYLRIFKIFCKQRKAIWI